jgi:hypothetical protein
VTAEELEDLKRSSQIETKESGLPWPDVSWAALQFDTIDGTVYMTTAYGPTEEEAVRQCVIESRKTLARVGSR